MTDTSWIKVETAGSVPGSAGKMCIDMTVSFQWWRWSFVRFVRSHITIEPRWLSWLAWPMAMWVALTCGPKMNRAVK